jgi:DNA-binding IclR family transcriptional regulator
VVMLGAAAPAHGRWLAWRARGHLAGWRRRRGRPLDMADPGRCLGNALRTNGVTNVSSDRFDDLAECEGSFPLRSHVLYEGIRFPLGVASAGLAILAHLPAAEADDYLAATDLTTRWGSAHSARSLRSRVAATRERGYAVNPGLVVEGSWGMAAVVFDHAGRPRSALSLTGVRSRFTDERIPTLGRMLLDRAHALSRRQQ